MTFSEVLNKHKSALNLTQSALAEICGTSPAVISRYLNGKRLPEKDSDIIKSIAKGIAEKSKDFPDLKLSAKDIEKELNDSLVSNDKESDFYSKLDALLNGKEVSNTELAKVLPYDSSYISRVRNKKRIPKDQEEFLSLLEAYLNNDYKSKPKTEKKTSAVKKTNSNTIKPAETPTVEVLTEEVLTVEEPTVETLTTETPRSHKRPRQTRFEYFLSKVSSYMDAIRNINLPL